jgi:hypothetical protein
LSRRRSAHSTRTPGDGSAKTEECQSKDEDHQDKQADNLGALPGTIARSPSRIMLIFSGLRRWLLARIHKPILRGSWRRCSLQNSSQRRLLIRFDLRATFLATSLLCSSGGSSSPSIGGFPFPARSRILRVIARSARRPLSRKYLSVRIGTAIRYRPFAGCNRSEIAMPDTGRDIPTAGERTDSTR